MSPEDKKKRQQEYDKKRLKLISESPELKKRKNEINNAYYHRNKFVTKWRNLKKYGLVKEDFERMLLEQNNCCAICSREFLDTPNTDHDHETGKARGLLCFHCNTGLGKFGDSENMLERALNYLKKSKQYVI